MAKGADTLPANSRALAVMVLIPVRSPTTAVQLLLTGPSREVSGKATVVVVSPITLLGVTERLICLMPDALGCGSTAEPLTWRRLPPAGVPSWGDVIVTVGELVSGNKPSPILT